MATMYIQPAVDICTKGPKEVAKLRQIAHSHTTLQRLVYVYVHGMTPSLPVSPLTDGALKLPLNQFEVLWRHLDGEEVEESGKLWLCDPTGVALSLHGGVGSRQMVTGKI